MGDESATRSLMEELARFVAARRSELGLGITEAARRAGLSDTRWRQIEDGAGGLPRSQSLSRIARCLEVDPERIFRLAGRTFQRTEESNGDEGADHDDLAQRVENVAASQEKIVERLGDIEGSLSQIRAAQERLENRIADFLTRAIGR